VSSESVSSESLSSESLSSESLSSESYGLFPGSIPKLAPQGLVCPHAR
jgi:hypothetical protein